MLSNGVWARRLVEPTRRAKDEVGKPSPRWPSSRWTWRACLSGFAASWEGARIVLISTRREEDFADLITASPAVGFLSKLHLSARAVRELVAGGYQ
jgi:hypothetical protein